MKKILRDIKLLWMLYPHAKSKVIEYGSKNKYVGEVKTQIAYRELVTLAKSKLGMPSDDITGAIVYLAISLAYLFNRSKLN